MISSSRRSPRTTRPDAPRLRRFCEQTLRLNNEPVRFEDRPFIDGIFGVLDKNIVIRAGRQVEKSTYISFRIGYELARPNTKVLLVCPRDTQAMMLIQSRFMPLLEQSPLLQNMLGTSKRRRNPRMMRFDNGSQLFVGSAFNSADSVRGVSADLLICDEYQDIAAGFLPVLKETLAHSSRPITILTGTSKEVTNHLEDAFARSTACAWTVRCGGCGTDVVPDQKCIGPDHYRCPRCETPVDWLRGRWVATNPHSTWGEGFWLPQLITPVGTPRKFFEKAGEYDRDRLLNEVFGLPTMHGTLAITRAELEACCSARPMAGSANDVPADARRSLVMGIDWGSGLGSEAAIVIASLCQRSQRLVVWRWELLGGRDRNVLDDVVQMCNRFGVAKIFADARGGGAHRNRELWIRLGSGPRPPIMGIEYGDSDGQVRHDGMLTMQVIDKTKWIAGLNARIREKRMEFPVSADCQLGFTHCGSEQVEYDEEKRTSRYRAADGRPDDLLHPLVYVDMGVRFVSGIDDAAYETSYETSYNAFDR